MSCVVCGEASKQGVSLCVKRECKKRLESLVLGDYVIKWLRDKTELAHIHIILGYKAFSSERWKLIAHPYPAYFDEHADLIKAIIPFDKLVEKNHENDTQLMQRIGEQSYVLVKFILMTAPKLSVVDNPPDGCKIYSTPNTSGAKDHVFHGSSDENWYSIIRNGLKVCSGTAWQKNGASFGNGIYLGRTLSISAGYGNQIVGVYKLLQTPTSRNNDILVVPDTSYIELSFLIVTKSLTPELQSEVLKKINKN